MNHVKALIILVIACSPLSLMADELVTRSFPFKRSIDTVEIHGIGELQIIQGDTEELTVTTTERMMKRVGARQENNTLSLSTQSKGWNIFEWGEDDDHVVFKLSLKQLKRLQAAGPTTIKMDSLVGDKFSLESVGAGRLVFGKLELGDINITLTGATQMDADYLTANRLNTELLGAAHFTLRETGSVAKLKVNAVGASQFHAPRLKSDVAELELAGASNAEVYAVQTLNISATGASSVDYYGSAITKIDTSGASNVNQRELPPESGQ